MLESARYDLSKNTIDSPIDGIVTRRNIQEGETAVIGTMNNAGTVLLTLADMSVIQAEVEVDETNIPSVQLGPDGEGHDRRPARQDVQGSRERDRQQPDSGGGRGGAEHRDAGDELQGGRDPRRTGARRPTGLHVHGRHHDGDAQGRDGRADSGGRRARADLRRERTGREGAEDRQAAPPTPTPETVASAAELKPGQTRKETEGVFVVRDGKAEFVPIKMGIAGDKYFEVLSGLKAGDQVITGPYNSVRGMADGDLVKVDNARHARRR